MTSEALTGRGSAYCRSMMASGCEDLVWRRGTVSRRCLLRFCLPFSYLCLAPVIWLLSLSVSFSSLWPGVTGTHSLSPTERRCASFSHLKVPFFFLDKAYIYDLSLLVTHAPPTGWVCKAEHANPVPFLGTPFAFLAMLFDDGDGSRADEKTPPDPHYELVDGEPVYYAFNPCRVLSRGCDGAAGAHGRLFMYKGDVSYGHCVSNVLPHPLPLSRWQQGLKRLHSDSWLHPSDSHSSTPDSSRAPGVPVPEGLVTGDEDPRWDPLDPLDPDDGVQVTFRYYDEKCPSQFAHIKVRVECDPVKGNGVGKTEFSSCKRTDKCIYEFSFQSPAGCPTGSAPYQPLLSALLEPVAEPENSSKKASSAAVTRSRVDVGRKVEFVPAIPLLSRQATEKVLDNALRSHNDFVLGEMRALSKSGILDTAIKQRLELSEKSKGGIPTGKPAEQRATLDARGSSSVPTSSGASGLLSRPAEMFSAVPHSLKATLTHPILEFHHDGKSNQLYLFLRIVFCALVILVAYFAIADWITREFAVRGTLKPPECGGSAGQAGDKDDGVEKDRDLVEALRKSQQWCPSVPSAQSRPGTEYGSFRECFRVLPLIDVRKKSSDAVGRASSSVAVKSPPLVQLPERQPYALVGGPSLSRPQAVDVSPRSEKRTQHPEVFRLSPRTGPGAGESKHSERETLQPVSSLIHAIPYDDWHTENSGGASTTEGSSREEGCTSSGSSRGSRTPRQYEGAFDAQPDAEDESAFSVQGWNGDDVRAGRLHEWRERALAMGANYRSLEAGGARA
ncbi:transmembrane protein [Cystoisospora suis]|uniref:Transmembrane protein n=1 Tax=Cystoisospora suis TaxID=483139 RepID=A0A2C6LAW7_9APIC|nr:transmembrane protein [Cystoisospora suis]